MVTMSNHVDHDLKEPSTLSFEQPRTRVWILTSYLLLVVLAVPLWWSTTSIERLSLPISRVDSVGNKEVSRHLNGCYETLPNSQSAPFSYQRRGWHRNFWNTVG